MVHLMFMLHVSAALGHIQATHLLKESTALCTCSFERHTQWDMKTATIYMIGRKSSYKIFLQHHNSKKLIIMMTTCLNEYYLTKYTVQ
jgi:hypothetical protein